MNRNNDEIAEADAAAEQWDRSIMQLRHQLHESLGHRIDQRRAARWKLESAADGLERGHRIDSMAGTQVSQLERQDASGGNDKASQHADSSSAVDSCASPPVGSAETFGQALDIARRLAAITAKAVAELLETHHQAQSDYAASDAAVRTNVIDIMNVELDMLNAHCSDLEDKIMAARYEALGLETALGHELAPLAPWREERLIAAKAVKWREHIERIVANDSDSQTELPF